MYHEFMELQQGFIDDGSYRMMQDLGEFYDPEVGELETIVSSDQGEITHALWGNLYTCPDQTGHEYTDLGFKFLIPQSLVLRSGLYRLLKTEYDHYSDSCMSYYAPGIQNALRQCESVILKVVLLTNI